MVAAALIVSGCNLSLTGTEEEAITLGRLGPRGISDGAHNEGNEHFYWLPPMAAAPNPSGVFDDALAPVVEICEWTGTACAFPIVATFTTTSGPGSEIIRVAQEEEHYIANWHTGEFNLDAELTYRIRVLIDGTEIGFADVDLVNSGRELKSVNTDEFIALKNNRTLPIKFRIEQGANAAPVTVSTLAGSGVGGYVDGNATAAQFNRPTGVAVDFAGNVFVADFNNHRIRKISPTGSVSTLAGSGVPGFADGIGSAAQFHFPTDVAVDSTGNVYVGDSENHRIRKITPAGAVSTLAGNGLFGFADGDGSNARFYSPYGVAVDSSSNVYVADHKNHRIRKITPGGVVSTMAGSGGAGFVDGPAATAQFLFPFGVTVDLSDNVYVGDQFNHSIRKITPAGVVSTLAGSGVAGFAEGSGISAQFNGPRAVTVDSSGNVYVADLVNHRIRSITPAGLVTTLAGSGVAGYADGTASDAEFWAPSGVAVDSSGNIFVAEFNNNRIRKIAP